MCLCVVFLSLCPCLCVFVCMRLCAWVCVRVLASVCDVRVRLRVGVAVCGREGLWGERERGACV